MEYNIAVIPGDGIGSEIVDGAVEILDEIAKKYDHTFNYTEVDAGGTAYDKFGDSLPQETIDVCERSDGILFGAVGGDQWDHVERDKRPEAAILGLRKALGLFANLRPGLLFEALKDSSPLKSEIVGDGFDILVVRELTGGIYFGENGKKETENGIACYDIEQYSEMEIKRIAKIAFEMALGRDKKVASIDKANVLESSKLWRETVTEMAKDYPEIELSHYYIDNAAMQVVRDPKQFDVILTTNLFGDILSDEISVLTGSIGLLPSASLGEGKLGLYEPIHGSAPDIAGKNIANPIGTILSAAMMLKYSLNLEEEAHAIEEACKKALNDGYRTADLANKGEEALGTKEITKVIKKYL